MSGHDDELIMISFIKLGPEVAPERFAEFATGLDLPTWRSKDVVLAFDTYRVEDGDGSNADGPGLDADFVEVMRVRSLAEWEEVGRTDPEIAPLGAAFDELTTGATVRRLVLRPLEDHSAQH